MLRIALLLAVATPIFAAETKPNVIIVMTDDNGLGDFSFTGNPVLKTPNFDKFAKESVRFTDFHVCPMCSPTRGQLMTGITALRNGATSVTAGRTFLRPGLQTMPELFAKAGYKTGLFGKWHLGDMYPHRPMDKGFHESVYHLGWGMLNATPEFDNPLFDGRCFHNGEAEKFTGHCTDHWFDSAMSWMKGCQEKSEPFFCYIPTNAPHAPYIDKDEYIKPYQGKGPAGFFGMCAHLDARFGDLDKFLDDRKLKENTIVVFMTDNGGTAGVATFNAGLRAGKTTYYDGGHRVPCWMRLPGRTRPGRDVDFPTSNLDILPTIQELCGVKGPEKPLLTKEEQQFYTGTSLVHVNEEGLKGFMDRMIVVQYGQTPTKFDCCIIWNKWRLVKGTELYDVLADRAQAKNVFDQNPDVVKAMKDYYEGWWKGVEPLLADFVPNHIGAKQQPRVELTSADWQDIYADNSGYVRQAVGGPTGGKWHIEVEQAGEYEFTLHRWPEQTKKALGDKYDGPEKGVKGQSVAFPTIAKAKVEIAGVKGEAAADAKAVGAPVRVTLPAGKTTLKAWFQDAGGKDLVGAFYVYVTRK